MTSGATKRAERTYLGYVNRKLLSEWQNLPPAEGSPWPSPGHRSRSFRAPHHRETLSLADLPVSVYIHDSLTPREALNLLVEHYKAWCVNRPGGRR